MSKDRKKPETKKSRTIDDLAGAIVALVEDSVYDPTKKQIVASYVSSQLGEAASTIAVGIMETEVANLLDTYWAEICAKASQNLDLPMHYTSKKWYDKSALMPKSKEEAKEYVITFGNGRRGKPAGVRFVTPEDEPDPMLLIALEKNIDVINRAIQTKNARIESVLASGAVSRLDAFKLRNRLPYPISQ
jgi:hypothetical protein